MTRTAARAEELRPYCPDRPGLGTPPCTIDRGHVSAEIGVVDWTRDKNGATRTDTTLVGDTLLRIGVDDHAEVQFGWTAFGYVDELDRVNDSHDRSLRTGDITLAIKRNLKNPDGTGTSVAVMPYATVPTGSTPVGAGDWSVGMLVPASFDLSGVVSLSLTPEIDAAADSEGSGRHLAYGTVVGLGRSLLDTLGLALEFSVTRDDDPHDNTTPMVAGISLGWQPVDGLQLDAGSNVGLNRDSADIEVYTGISRRF